MSNRNNTDETASMQGVLIELFGIGIIITGGSGIGKSECGLELITRGHRLVADDSVDIIKAPDGTLYGKCPDVTRHFMEIRGIGVVNVESLFGRDAVSDGISVDIIVELIRWEDWNDMDRLGSKEQHCRILAVDLPILRLPVRSGGNMATVIEIVARNHILKKRGYNASMDLIKKVSDKIRKTEKR
ncbi:MAG: hypothetical protein J7K35_09015 [Syntrophobacterales bacterium]|nr:hypothetical protein [Syntrophobacterales bacterium]